MLGGPSACPGRRDGGSDGGSGDEGEEPPPGTASGDGCSGGGDG